MAAVSAYDDHTADAWHRTRLSSYIVYCSNTKEEDRVDIYEFMPLRGDPTPEELADKKQKEKTAKREKIKEMMQCSKEYTAQVRKEAIRIKEKYAAN